MPIRENKKWGKEIVMSVCLTQSNNFAGRGDSQRNLRTCEVDKSRKVSYNILVSLAGADYEEIVIPMIG